MTHSRYKNAPGRSCSLKPLAYWGAFPPNPLSRFAPDIRQYNIYPELPCEAVFFFLWIGLEEIDSTVYLSFVRKYTATVGRMTNSISEISTKAYDPK